MNDLAAQRERKRVKAIRRLYKSLGVPSGVLTPSGPGTLVQAFSCRKGCRVQLANETERMPGSKGEFRTRNFDVAEVRPNA